VSGKEYARERYMRLKLEGRCVYCAAGLPEDASSIFCVECSAMRQARRRAWRKDNAEAEKERARDYRARWTKERRDA
jgi:hypothetical protein